MLRILNFAVLGSLCVLQGKADYLSDYGQFEGGSISFSVRNDSAGRTWIDLDVLTGWVLGKGPCGSSCSRADIGGSTTQQRLAKETAIGDSIYFGNWSTEYNIVREGFHTHYQTADLNSAIKSTMTEVIIRMNKALHWEQDMMKVSVEREPRNTGHIQRIYFEGESWYPASLLPWNETWHIQAILDYRLRSDTGRPNRSPIAFVRPMIRLKLNQVNRIYVVSTDPDNDLIKCHTAVFSDSGSLSRTPMPGLTVNQDCTVDIDTDSAKYHYIDGYSGAVAVVVEDYSRTDIKLDTEHVQAYRYSLSHTPVQFLVQVVADLNGPEFVSPTPMASHHFTLYNGSSLKTSIFAKTNGHRTISKFIATGREQEVVSVSQIKDGHESNVRYVELTWTPNATDTGNHIICVTALDDLGVQSEDDRCFTIEIKLERFNHSSPLAVDRPYFFNIPAIGQTIECSINVTYVLPLYIESNVGVKSFILQRKVEVTETGPITLTHINGQQLYQSDLTFSQSSAGQHEVCVIAVGSNGELSDAICIQANFAPPDPCISNPCFNSGSCLRSKKDPNAYTCHCLQFIHGQHCETQESFCSLYNPCTHGPCYDLFPNEYYCDCSSTVYEGRNCSRPSSNCRKENCIHGVCQTLALSSHCVCDAGYVGQRCDTKSP